MALFGKMTQKEPSEMERVLEYIAQVEREMQEKLFQLGQIYFERHKNQPEQAEDGCRELVTFINKLGENRKGYYKNKLRLEGKMLCENCGATIPYGSMFCSSCGKSANQKEEGTADQSNQTQRRVCSNCQASLEEGDAFCVACGTQVN